MDHAAKLEWLAEIVHDDAPMIPEEDVPVLYRAAYELRRLQEVEQELLQLLGRSL